MMYKTPGRRFTTITASAVIGGAAVAIIGGLFTAEGLLGYFYNASMFWEGLNHIWEIYGGLVTVVAGAAISIYTVLRQ